MLILYYFNFSLFRLIINFRFIDAEIPHFVNKSSEQIQAMVSKQSKAGAELLESVWVTDCVELIKSQQGSIEAIVPQEEVSVSMAGFSGGGLRNITSAY